MDIKGVRKKLREEREQKISGILFTHGMDRLSQLSHLTLLFTENKINRKGKDQN
jgi:energy-coupling factor transporter ATP-binding protein EcfA2